MWDPKPASELSTTCFTLNVSFHLNDDHHDDDNLSDNRSLFCWSSLLFGEILGIKSHELGFLS